MLPNGPDLDYLGYLASESARFADVLSQAPPDAAVPSCPDWTAADLLWHLGQVQWFWGTVVREELSGEQAQARKPQRPGDWPGLIDFFAAASRDLNEVLTATAPETTAWTWSADQTVRFIRRRQAHEALIHRVDAELISGNRSPVDPLLGADGTDEALRVMYCGVPDWGTFTPQHGRTVRLAASDTGDSWLVTVGRFTGTNPDDGKSLDEPDIGVADSDPGGQAAATITGSAADLDCWLWHRPPAGPVDRSGDQDVLSDFGTGIAPGIN